MENFLQAFFAVDTDNSETITREELVSFMKANHFKPAFVEKWMSIFDEDGDDVITLHEYCHALGLEIEDARSMRGAATSVVLPPWVQVIKADMDAELQLEIVQMAQKVKKQSENEREWAKVIKGFLDSMNPMWHVFICTGDHWMFYSHEPGHAFHFKIGQHIFLVWKTPAL